MKCTPKIGSTRKTVKYDTLKNGEAFVLDSNLYIKLDAPGREQEGISLNQPGWFVDDMCGNEVIPVNAEIKWSYKK